MRNFNTEMMEDNLFIAQDLWQGADAMFIRWGMPRDMNEDHRREYRMITRDARKVTADAIGWASK
jgi:hypothetical protein